MTQFQVGQEVEVLFSEAREVQIGEGSALEVSNGPWRKGKMVCRICDVGADDSEFGSSEHCNSYEVQFPNGTRAIFTTEHIRGTP